MKTAFLTMALLGIGVFVLSGCGQAASTAKPQADAHEHGDGHDAHAAEEKEAGHDHSGWWCNEHGVPEEVCGQCNSKLAADFQKKGDWCQEHNRPDSQCFICHPELEAKFAAQYEAKYGKQPPKPEVN